MDEEIEMNDLLGHTEEIMSEEEEKDPRQDKGIGAGPGSERRMVSRTRMNRCHILAILVLLIGTVSYLVDMISFARKKTDALLEIDEETQKAKTGKKIDGTQIGDQNNFETGNAENEIVGNNPSTQQGDCIDDPDFRFKNNPKKTCNWVAQNHDNACHRKKLKKHCPVSCGVCFGQEDQETQIKNTDSGNHDGSDISIENVAKEHAESKGNNDKNGEYQSTIVAGVDDKDVYCEDLSRYKEWHETRISKDDGKMFKIVKQMTHDKTSFTQGLTYAGGKLFESAGLYGKSTVRILDSKTASVEKMVSMGSRLFAEGLAYFKDTLVQITWKSRRGFLYDITTLEEIRNFTFTTTLNEGWGITWDRCKDELIVTDGSANLHFWDPRTMKEIRRVSVTRMNGLKALEMNEIEFWRGRVLANIWYEDVVLVIDPETGSVEKEYDFSELWPRNERKREFADVLNGISISGDPDVLYFTGKKWNRMYEIQLLPEL